VNDSLAIDKYHKITLFNNERGAIATNIEHPNLKGNPTTNLILDQLLFDLSCKRQYSK
jgi:hypothetical protein